MAKTLGMILTVLVAAAVLVAVYNPVQQSGVREVEIVG